MPISDFYKGTTKKFNVVFYYQNVIQDISTDTVTIGLWNSGSNLEFTSSADVSTSGSNGTAIFNLTPTFTDTIPVDIYKYEIVWNVSSSNDEYVVDTGEVYVKDRII